MAAHILARELGTLVATLADLGDYLAVDHDQELELDPDCDRRTLEMFAGDALRSAVQARRSIALCMG